ncbi:MAG: HU family DNA-binding protein [Gammaproteobacteria bacterium]
MTGRKAAESRPVFIKTYTKGKTMNKTELIESIAKEAGLSKADAARALDAFVDTVSKSLKKKKPVVIVGFGSFDVQKRKARIGRNPQTGAELKIKASIAPKFRPGKSLKDAVNK